jgi:hypothetical protein
MYYLLSFKLLRRKQGGHNVSQHTTRLDTEFIGFSEFLRSLPEDKKIAVGREIKKRMILLRRFLGTEYIRFSIGW